MEAQQQFRDYIPGFTFNLGFCGQYYCKGTGGSVEGSSKNRRVLLEARKVGFVESSTARSGIILILCNDKQVKVENEASAVSGRQVGLWEALQAQEFCRRYTTSTARGSVGLVVREGGRGGEEKRSGGEGIRGGAVEGGS